MFIFFLSAVPVAAVVLLKYLLQTKTHMQKWPRIGSTLTTFFS